MSERDKDQPDWLLYFQTQGYYVSQSEAERRRPVNQSEVELIKFIRPVPSAGKKREQPRFVEKILGEYLSNHNLWYCNA